jgi:hypothetical protein
VTRATTKKDSTAAERARRYRERRRLNAVTAPERDASVTAQPPGKAVIAVEKATMTVVPSVTPTVTAVTDPAGVTVLRPAKSGGTACAIAIAVGLLALALAAVGFYQNAVFLFGFGRVMDAAGLASLGLVCDVGTWCYRPP